ncbi:MAG TPA: response regulator [Caulobacteraceae bacterium]|nr:response regulator [Caulobacteraceae bacterium]
MLSIASLLENADPVGAATPSGAVAELFLNAPASDLLAVVEDGRPLGVVSREAAKGRPHDQSVSFWMAPAVTVDAGLEVDEACRRLLSEEAGCAGLVVVEGGRYCGVVSAHALLRRRMDESTAAQDNLRFVQMVSHEVRAPMNGVLAVAELLQRQALSLDSQAHVRTIIDSSLATLRALNDVLELSRAETGELELEPSDVVLRDVMDQVQTTWQARAAQDGVTLMVAYDGEPHLSVQVDAARIKQVFDKLIDAALSLSRRGVIEASLQATRGPDGLRLTGSVRDTGGGLSAAKLARAFSQQGSQSAASASLGMMLCRRIVERMGGEIRAESNVGAGATIAFEFTALESVADESDDRGSVSGSRAAHVLVVDDNATNRMVAEALCEMFDCTSECVEDGVEAVKAASTGRFDLILMDIRMPRMDGVEATRAIRALDGPAAGVPIIALTANADPEDAQGYIACGMHDVVEKPIKPERLLQAMNAALSAAPSRAAAA